ncbi:MFS transporter [Arthrobacter sp. MYb227]|uniref:MFS transporter n=1 Tax=Arthrobacter sp. MYb227 TaxID=1848601 RepID=UPI000CFE21CD|nr:MFS transporter [Arthrobacter sp. MYb227]PQZ93940.1 MFS transporter [Arthrobacter sp. MYb227]
MQTIVVPLIPNLPAMLNTSAADASWVITVTLLAGAIITPIAGRLGDMLGKRLVLLLSLLILTGGSIICALSDSLLPMVVGRGLQGLAMGAIPLGIGILRDELPREKMGSAVATMSATMGVGGAIGLPASAAVAQFADWHTLFWGAAGLGAISFAAVLFLLPRSTLRTPARFDFLGALGLAAGLVALLLPISKGSTWGWGSVLTLSCFAAALVLLLLWGFHERRTASPLVDLRISARPSVLFTNFASIAVGFSMYAMNLAFPQLLMAPASTGYGMGLSMLQAGLVLTPGGLMMMAISPVSARLSARSGPKITLITGTAVIGAGYVLALVLNSQMWHLALASMVICGGIGLAYAAMPALIMGAVDQRETGAANGLNALMRSVGTAVSAAVTGVVLASMSIMVGKVPVPTMAGFQMSFILAIASALVAIILALFIPRAGKLSRVSTSPKRASVSAKI